jgi:hypothetical protein
MKERFVRTFARWQREPLVHFIALGAALFAVHHWVAPAPPQRIVLSDAVINGLRQDHVRRTGTPPTTEEEAALIQRYVDDEVLYREALALGLDRGDIIVRRRLVQKMEFLNEDLEPIPEPSAAELQAYAEAHPERYAAPARVALTHVFLSTDRRGQDAERGAAALRAQLLAGADPAGLGDPFLRGREFPLRTERELAAIFGAPFAARVISEPVGTWSEPLRSSYGVHLVRVTGRQAAHPPDLADIGEAARRDWREERRARANRAALARLRERYEIQFEDSGKTALASDFPLAAQQ